MLVEQVQAHVSTDNTTETRALAHMYVSLNQAAPKLLQCQGAFMATTAPPLAPRSVWTAAVHSVLSTLRASPALLPAYTAAAAVHSGPELAHAIALHIAKAPDEATSSALVQLYCTRVLGSKEVLAPDAYALYAALVAQGSAKVAQVGSSWWWCSRWCACDVCVGVCTQMHAALDDDAATAPQQLKPRQRRRCVP